MKVLVTKAGGNEVLTVSYGAATDFELLIDGNPRSGFGFVAEIDDAAVKRLVKTRTEGSYLRPSDLNRDLKFIASVASDYEDGTKVTVKSMARGIKLVPDESGRIDRAGELAEGDLVAVGPNISPKALMNLHGLVVAIRGQKVEIEADDGDLDRLRRATGKTWGATIRMPLSSLEKIA